MGKPSRDKGRRYEQWLARHYREHDFPCSRNSNQAHPDAQGDDPKGDLLGVHAGAERIHCQAKHDERKSIWAMLRQAEEEAPAGWVPAVHFHKNHSGHYVAIPLDDWTRMLDAVRRAPKVTDVPYA